MCVNVVVIICMYYVGERKPTGKKITTNKTPQKAWCTECSLHSWLLWMTSSVFFLNILIELMLTCLNIYIKKNVFYAIPNLLCALYIHASGRSHQRHDL